MKKRHMLASAILATSLTLISCGPRVIDQGVLVWSTDEEPLPSGSIVDILTESELRQSYNIRYIDSEDREQFIEVENWRILRGEDREDLQRIFDGYAEWAPYFGVAEIQALPVRRFMATDPTSTILYRLREGERVKILDRTDDVVEVGGLTDYWFEIITENGTRGFVFGYRLDVVDNQGVSIEKEETEEDVYLSSILNGRWRPDYFGWMIRDNTYDLSRFRDEYFFAHDAENQTFTLVTEEYNQVFSYDEIFRARFKEYVASGSGLQISAFNERNISIQFNLDGDTYQESLVRIDQDVSLIIENELGRRQRVLEDFVSRGGNLASSSYGSIQLSENGSLSWSRYGGLDQSMLPPWFTGRAQLSFNLYVSRQVSANYDGAVSMTQPGQSIRNSMNFFYRFANGGLQLEYIPPQNIDRNLVIRQALSPFVIFFTIEE